jgi:hypothetical protein
MHYLVKDNKKSLNLKWQMFNDGPFRTYKVNISQR